MSRTACIGWLLTLSPPADQAFCCFVIVSDGLHMIAGAFFDLDLTLLSVNSASLWVRHEYQGGRISFPLYCEAIYYLIAYRLGLIDIEKAMQRALATVRGADEGEFRQRTRRWYREDVAKTLTPGGKKTLATHRKAGHPLVLLTTSSPYEAEIVAETLELDGWLATSYEVSDGLLTGRVVGPVCYGPGKVVHARRFAEQHGINLSESYFYSDSISDLPMLEAVGYPKVVNPDLRLRMAAYRRSWTILDWRSKAKNPMNFL